MSTPSRQDIFDRAGGCCEYCRMPQELTVVPHEVDHIRAQKHGGTSTGDNLALCCFYCNSFKGPNIAGIDPDTDTLQPLYHPRKDHWKDHFEWNGPELVGKTAIGRTTIEVLNVNLPERVEHRRLLIESGDFPPRDASKDKNE